MTTLDGKVTLGDLLKLNVYNSEPTLEQGEIAYLNDGSDHMLCVGLGEDGVAYIPLEV